jgi:hypothetical protein
VAAGSAAVAMVGATPTSTVIPQASVASGAVALRAVRVVACTRWGAARW